MFNVRFFKFEKRENSTKRPNLTEGLLLSVILKENTSLNNPTFLIDFNDANAWPDYNYCYVVPWNKYFFVNDWTNEGNLWRAQCNIDVLATYKTEILASTQFVSYSSVIGNTWLPDTRIPVLRSTNVQSASVAAPFFVSDGWYILSCIGKVASTLYALKKGQLLKLISQIAEPTYVESQINNAVDNINYDWTQGAEGGLYYLSRVVTQNDILGRAYATAPDCLRSCIYVPLLVHGSDSPETIWLGNYETTALGVPIDGAPETGSVSVSIPWTFSDWRRGYCEQVYLYLPLVGMVALSGDSITHVDALTVEYSYTITDGTVAYRVLAGSEIIGTYGGSCAINYPLGVNQQASAGQVTNAIMQGVTQSVAAGITGNITGAVMGIASAAYNAIDVALTSHPSSVGGIGGGAGGGLSRNITCYTVAHNTNVEPSAMAATMGRPTMKPQQLSNCSGYCQCANAHVAANASLEELNAITTMLNSGFYIE